MQEHHPDCSRVAQHALVLGPCDYVQSDFTVPAQSADPMFQSDPSQKSAKSKSTCLALRTSAIKEQGFSEAVAAQIEALLRQSGPFLEWCHSNQVDFRAPPIKSIANFLLYLFQDRNLQPSTIDGYRAAIADKLGNLSINVSKDENLTCLLDSFHRDRSKGRRASPPETFAWFCTRSPRLCLNP